MFLLLRQKLSTQIFVLVVIVRLCIVLSSSCCLLIHDIIYFCYIIELPPAASSGSSSSLVPALGEAWSHLLTHRLLLSYPSSTATSSSTGSKEVIQMRCATLIKSSAFPPKSVDFVISKKGIRDVPPSLAVVTQSVQQVQVKNLILLLFVVALQLDNHRRQLNH